MWNWVYAHFLSPTHTKKHRCIQQTHNTTRTASSITFTNKTVSSACSFSNLIHDSEKHQRNIFITVCRFQMQTFFPQVKACLWWDKSEHTPAWEKQTPQKIKTSPICAHFRLNMNWPKSPPVEAFLVSAGPGYLIWTQALGSPEFIQ